MSSPGSFAEAVADVILRQYHRLPKTGKPQPNEHTVLAGFAISLDDPPRTQGSCDGERKRLPGESAERPCDRSTTHLGHPQLVPVALGTGTKCMGSRQSRHQIDVINDSHAEVSTPCSAHSCPHRNWHQAFENGLAVINRSLLLRLYWKQCQLHNLLASWQLLFPVAHVEGASKSLS